MHSRRPPLLRHKRTRGRNPQTAPTIGEDEHDLENNGKPQWNGSSSHGSKKPKRRRVLTLQHMTRVCYFLLFLFGLYLYMKIKAFANSFFPNASPVKNNTPHHEISIPFKIHQDQTVPMPERITHSKDKPAVVAVADELRENVMIRQETPILPVVHAPPQLRGTKQPEQQQQVQQQEQHLQRVKPHSAQKYTESLEEPPPPEIAAKPSKIDLKGIPPVETNHTDPPTKTKKSITQQHVVSKHDKKVQQLEKEAHDLQEEERKLQEQQQQLKEHQQKLREHEQLLKEQRKQYDEELELKEAEEEEQPELPIEEGEEQLDDDREKMKRLKEKSPDDAASLLTPGGEVSLEDLDKEEQRREEILEEEESDLLHSPKENKNKQGGAFKAQSSADDMTGWQSLVKAQHVPKVDESLLAGASMRHRMKIMNER